MGIFAGLVVHRALISQRRYDQVVNEIYQYLLLHKDEIQVKIESNRFLSVQALYGSDMALIPISIHNLHTQFFRIHSGSTPPEDVKQFGSVLWECLNILKEHYPSYIEVNHENLDKCLPFYVEITAQEALRRQVSCIASRADDTSILLSEEMNDIWFVLYSTIKVYDIKSTLIILEILNSNIHCPAAVFKTAKPEDLRLLESIKNDSEENINNRLYPGLTDKSKNISYSILRKIILKYPERLQDCPSLVDINVEPKNSVPAAKYEVPCSVAALMFQLTETTSLERATFLLQSLNTSQNLQELNSMRWPEKLRNILEKYCEKLFTCDNYDLIKYGIFHHALINSILNLSTTSESFIVILNLGFFERFYELVEEVCRLMYQLIIHKEDSEDSKLSSFIDLSLKLVELIINPGYYKFLRPVNESLARVSNIINSFTHHSFEENAMPAPEDPEELKLLSPELFEYKSRIQTMATKIEALLEYQERHEEKFKRLFSSQLENSS
jgi:hypothetical protein